MGNSLNGLRILNTRPREQGQILTQQITEAGGISIVCPTIEISESNTDWIHELPDLNQVDHAIFISANAVHYCFKQLQHHLIQWPISIHIIAIGQGTEQALRQYQLKANDIPLIPDSEHLLTLASLQQLKQKTVLLFKGIEGRTVIEEGLRLKQAKLVILAVYQRFMPEINQKWLNSLWRNDAVDIILLTSEESMRNLFQLFSQEAHIWLQKKPCLVISERLAQTASLLGIKNIKLSHPNRIINTLYELKN